MKTHDRNETGIVIPGFPNYSITEDGRVWSKSRKTFLGQKIKGRWLKPTNPNNKYWFVSLCHESKIFTRTIHRLVLETYVGPRPDGMEGRHLDGNPRNNNLDNLCWGTPKENQADSEQHGTSVKGEKVGTSKLKERDVRMIIYMYRTGLFSQRDIAKIYKISQNSIKCIVNRQRWKHIWNI